MSRVNMNLAPSVERARIFGEHFAGRTLYAVKANPTPALLSAIAPHIFGFDVASIEEVAVVATAVPGARMHFMNPVKPYDAMARAYRDYGLTDFAVDSVSEVDKLRDIVAVPANVTAYVRVDVDDTGSLFPVRGKFGVSGQDAKDLIRTVVANGFRLGITFHVGGQCNDVALYTNALQGVLELIRATSAPVASIDIGGGFPGGYGYDNEPALVACLTSISRWFASHRAALAGLEDVYCEPGRAIAAPCASVTATVISRRSDGELFIDDGIYGTLSELPELQHRVDAEVTRGGVPVGGEKRRFSVYGPTCNGADALGDQYLFTDEIRAGDEITFKTLGAYSTALATRFNGFCFGAGDG